METHNRVITRRRFIASTAATAAVSFITTDDAEAGLARFQDRPHYFEAGRWKGGERGLFVFLHEMAPNQRVKKQFVPSAKHAYFFWKKTRLFGGDTVLVCPQGQTPKKKQPSGLFAERSWSPEMDEEYLEALIPDLVERYGIDPKLVFFGGFGQDARYTFTHCEYHFKTRFEAALLCSPFALTTKDPRPREGHDPRYYLHYSTNNEVVNADALRRFTQQWNAKARTVVAVEDTIGHAMGKKTIELYKQMRYAKRSTHDSPGK